jgi:hypothetical protein
MSDGAVLNHGAFLEKQLPEVTLEMLFKKYIDKHQLYKMAIDLSVYVVKFKVQNFRN